MCRVEEAVAVTDTIRALGLGPVPVCVDMREMSKLERSAREHLVSDQGGTEAIALLGGSPVSDTASRIERIVDLLARLASGDVSARSARSDKDDDIDAVIEGINMLAEELEASHSELEQRVQERTIELEAVNADMLRLAELGNLLAACETHGEAYTMMGHGLKAMFDSLSGAVYVFRSSRNILEPRVSWGDISPDEPLNPRDCWALRRGHSHHVDHDEASLSCGHIARQLAGPVAEQASLALANIDLRDRLRVQPSATR